MKKLLVVLLLIVAVGCSKPYTKTPDEAMTSQETVTEEVMTTGTEADEVVEPILVVEAEEVVEETLSAEDRAKEAFKDVLFDYDKYDIRPEARPALDSVADFLNNERTMNVVIEGHCDERGTNEYNLALGEKRAKAAKTYLIARGISSARIIVITYGEEKPACMDQNDSCWQKNRRAHFVATR